MATCSTSDAMGIGYALGAATGCVLGHGAMRSIIDRRLHGYTGDTLGAVQQISGLGIYLAVVWWAT